MWPIALNRIPYPIAEVAPVLDFFSSAVPVGGIRVSHCFSAVVEFFGLDRARNLFPTTIVVRRPSQTGPTCTGTQLLVRYAGPADRVEKWRYSISGVALDERSARNNMTSTAGIRA